MTLRHGAKVMASFTWFIFLQNITSYHYQFGITNYKPDNPKSTNYFLHNSLLACPIKKCFK
jgi:hypothetical protein